MNYSISSTFSFNIISTTHQNNIYSSFTYPNKNTYLFSDLPTQSPSFKMQFTQVLVSTALLASAQLVVAAPTPQIPWGELAEGAMSALGGTGGASGGQPTTSTSGAGPATNGGISQSATSSSGGGGGLLGGLLGNGGKSTTNNNANSGTLGQGAVSGVNGDVKQSGAAGSNIGNMAGMGAGGVGQGNSGSFSMGPNGSIGGAGEGAGAGMSCLI